LKTMLMTNKNKEILYISNCYKGSIHDYKILKKEFPIDKNWFVDLSLIVDLGYFGIEKDYKCKKVIILDKKKRNKELSRSQKIKNKKKSKQRIKIEHSICGIKKYKIISEKSRIRDINLYNRVLGICSALLNFYLKN